VLVALHPYNNSDLLANSSPLVTGENSPTAAHAGRKRRITGVPVPGGISGPPCPGGYKYGGLALQVGGWARSRLPVTVKKTCWKT
jgi:hypothetical protein